MPGTLSASIWALIFCASAGSVLLPQYRLVGKTAAPGSSTIETLGQCLHFGGVIAVCRIVYDGFAAVFAGADVGLASGGSQYAVCSIGIDAGNGICVAGRLAVAHAAVAGADIFPFVIGIAPHIRTAVPALCILANRILGFFR